MKKIIAILLISLITLTAAACSCGGSDTKGGDSQDTVAETTKVLETTPDGGTVEEDKDGNKIEKDKTGEIVSVTDSDGNSVDVEEYKAAHPDVNGKKSSSSSAESGTTSKGSGGKTSSKTSSNSSKSSSGKTSSKNSGSKTDETNSSKGSENEEAIEGEIPTIVVTMPENPEDLPELPDL